MCFDKSDDDLLETSSEAFERKLLYQLLYRAFFDKLSGRRVILHLVLEWTAYQYWLGVIV